MAKPAKSTKKEKLPDPLLARSREGMAGAMPALHARRNRVAFPEAGRVASAVARLERLDAQIGQLNEAKSAVFRELRRLGYDVAAVRQAVKERRLDPQKRQERREVFALYWEQLEAAMDAAEADGDAA